VILLYAIINLSPNLCGQILVVHGIGQAMKRVELGVTQLKGIVECCDVMRSNTEEINRPEDSSAGPTDTSASGVAALLGSYSLILMAREDA
jgi:hypothetical protein